VGREPYWKEYLPTWIVLFLMACTTPVLVMVVMLLNQSGFFHYTEEPFYPSPNREFSLKVEETGRTIYTGTENVSKELREEIMGTVYETPEAALDAAHDPLPGNPAYAHAVLKCTQRDGVVSEDTGGGYHLTYHRYDRNGYRFTKTYHMVRSHPAPVATDVFYAKIDKRYC
jgi:hypothetical protein